MSQKSPIAVVIVTHRGGVILDTCIKSVQAESPNDLLVVVSNTTLAVVGARVLQLGSNVGFARAANAGIAAVQGDVLLLNDDTVIHPGCINAFQQARLPEPQIYQPRISLVDGSGLDNEGHGFFPDGFVWARGRGGPDVSLPRTPGGFSGAAVLFDRRAWDALGGFDPRFDSFGEDVDLSLRWMRRGGRIVPVPSARVSHHLGASYGRADAGKLHRIERNRIRAAVRSLPLGALVTAPFWTAARLGLFAGLSLRGQGPGAAVPASARLAALRGLAAGVADAPAWWGERQRDRPSWKRGELEMWRTLWKTRARWEDVCR